MTTTRQLTAIALGILALIYLVTGVAHAIIVVTQLLSAGQGGSHWGWWGSASAIATQLIAGGLLLTFAGRLAGLLIPDSQPVQIGLGEEWPRALYLCCVRVAGVLVVVHGIPKVIAQLTHYGFFRSQSLTLPIPRDVWADGLAAVAYVALGIYLIKGGGVFLRLAEGSAGEATG